MPSNHNSGVMSTRAQAVFFGILACVFLVLLVALPIFGVDVGRQVTFALIAGMFLSLGVLCGRCFTESIIDTIQRLLKPPNNPQE